MRRSSKIQNIRYCKIGSSVVSFDRGHEILLERKMDMELLSEKLKSLRKEKGCSQEKLAQYLSVSFQAVSKWENGNACPDISLLPGIARFFGITVDELLQVEKIDEKRRYEEYEKEAEALFRNGKWREALEVWLKAYKEMPNSVKVKEMLMSSFYDVDKVKYKNEIIELGTEIYHSDVPSYYKGQAIKEIANTYAANGDLELAEKWVLKSYQVIHSQEVLFTQILDGGEMLHEVSFFTYWVFNNLAYMAYRIDHSETVPIDARQKQAIFKTLSRLYEVLYPNDDMSFESLKLLYIVHRRIAELEIALENDESIIKYHMERAFACVEKSLAVKEHDLTHPLLDGWHVAAAPSDNTQWIRMMRSDLGDTCFDSYRTAPWFISIEKSLAALL